MKSKKLKIKVISFLLAFVMIVVSTPIQAISLNTINKNEDEVLKETITTDTKDVEQEVFIVEEDTSKRGQFEKHYLCSDGTYVTVMYPEAIHYLDNENKWQDVDQSLVYDSSKGIYKSKDTDFYVSFSDKVSSTNMVRMEQNGYALSWGIQTAKKQIVENSEVSLARTEKITTQNTDNVLLPLSSVYAKPVEKKVVNFEKASERLVSNEDSFVLQNMSSQIRYTNIFSGTENVSLKYTVYHNKIEEDIIISEKGDISSVSMNMDIGTLIPIVNEDGSVDLVNSNNDMQFHIGIPYMIDANNSVCNDIEVTAEKNGSNCIITYTPDFEWFESTQRAFPIMLDPSITTNSYLSNVIDTYVEENSTVNHRYEQQLFVNDNGSNRRKAIVRLTSLPKIDASMPIVRAELKLTAQTPSNSTVFIRATYCWAGLDFDDYDYEMTSYIPPTYSSRSYLSSGSSTVSFDFSQCIYEMYENEKTCNENGDFYKGDFIIECDEESEHAYIPPFYSSECTTLNNRPMFTIQYGYTLPAGMMDGEVYSFQNVLSAAYMTVNSRNPENGSNVYQAWYGNTAEVTQKFRLGYVPATGGYLLKPITSSSGDQKVVAIKPTGGVIFSNRNVYISYPTDSFSQEWLIVPIDYNIFRIVPRANMSYAVTANGFEDGTNEGNIYSSEGNIFVKALAEDDLSQQWHIYDNENNILNTSKFRADIETGNYYITNKNNGKYLHTTGLTADCIRKRKSTLEMSTVLWKIINLGNGYFTIQCSDVPRFYLSWESTANGSSIKVYSHLLDDIPEKYQWTISAAKGGGFLIQNRVSGLYLRALDQSKNPSDLVQFALIDSSADEYQELVWRFANEDYYTELHSNFSFNDISVKINKSVKASINKYPTNAIWSSYTDFDYTITSGSQYVSYDDNTHKFTGLAIGTASVTAVHKTTGMSKSFNVTVYEPEINYKPAVILIHGRSENSFTTWGASSNVYVDITDTSIKGNNHYNRYLNATTEGDNQVQYIQPSTQQIQYVFDSKYPCEDSPSYATIHPEGGNLAYYLVNECGYNPNVNLFVFNYPNEDAVVHNANKLDAYLSNLASEIRAAGSSQAKYSFFGTDKNLTADSPYCIDIVAHSMGGLVARYYIENIGKDENIRKLITIGTPHWGTGLVYGSNIVGVNHKLCDHDLAPYSKMTGGINDTLLECNLCNVSSYEITDELNYDAERSTKYYAIAGIDYNSDGMEKNNCIVEISSDSLTFLDIKNEIYRETNNSLYMIPTENIYVIRYMDIKNVGDNLVGFLSQIGCTETGLISPDKKITFERIIVNIDSDGGNNLFNSNHFHGKMPHRKEVMEKVFEFLSEL